MKKKRGLYFFSLFPFPFSPSFPSFLFCFFPSSSSFLPYFLLSARPSVPLLPSFCLRRSFLDCAAASSLPAPMLPAESASDSAVLPFFGSSPVHLSIHPSVLLLFCFRLVRIVSLFSVFLFFSFSLSSQGDKARQPTSFPPGDPRQALGIIPPPTNKVSTTKSVRGARKGRKERKERNRRRAWRDDSSHHSPSIPSSSSSHPSIIP